MTAQQRPDLEYLPLPDRPRFARKMVAVWRLQHIANGEEMSVTIWPGEWPAGVPRVVKGVPVVEDNESGGAGGVMVLGRVGEVWRAAYNLAVAPYLDMTAAEVAELTVFMEVGPDRNSDLKMWLHPSPVDGSVPMWQIPPREGDSRP